MARPVTDVRWPPGIDYAAIFKVATQHAPEEREGLTLAEYAAEYIEPAIIADGEWTAPSGVTIVTVLGPQPHGRMVCGYRRLDPDDWFTCVTESGTVRGPYPTKKDCLLNLGADSAAIRSPGLYETEFALIFTRDTAVAALGRELTREER